MFDTQVLRLRKALVLLAAVALLPAAWADSTDEKFYRAYYLEIEKGELAKALQLYDDIAGDRRAGAEVRAKARARRDACREELTSADFARLMPVNTLAYIELNRPGGQVSRLLTMLGLMREDGSLAADPQRRIAISPAVIRELLGIRGVAVAITGFDPAAEAPMGVAVLHPGDIDVIRGLIETALPAAAEFDEPIEGFPTYAVEGQVYVTLTHRLVIVSQQREEIEGVIYRLKGEDSESLADSPDLATAMRHRDDSLLFFCVNFKPMMPLINMALAAAGTQSQEVAMAQALLDPKSLRTLAGRVGVSDEGIHVDMTLELDEAHRNLAFHFLRFPPVSRETLKRVPAGAAMFFVAGLNEAGVLTRSTAATPGEPQPITMFDIGRELFANIVSVAVFMAPVDEVIMVDGDPIPPVAAVFTVNDPAKSMALWTQLLGIGSLASGAGTLDGMQSDIDGFEARRFVFPDDISVYIANVGDDIVISPSKESISRSLATRRSGESILSDPAFAASLKRLGPDATFALFAHVGRCGEMAKGFADDDDIEEMEPIIGLMSEDCGVGSNGAFVECLRAAHPQ